MASVEIALICLLPRWMLASDPHVSVNGSLPSRLTKQPQRFDVEATDVNVVVPFEDSDASLSQRRHFTAITRGHFFVGPDECLVLGFHPAIMNSSAMFRGHLWRRRR